MKGGLGTILAIGTPEKGVSGKGQLYFKFSIDEPKVLCEPVLSYCDPHTSACPDLASHSGPQIFLSRSSQFRLCPIDSFKTPQLRLLQSQPCLPGSYEDFL